MSDVRSLEIKIFKLVLKLEGNWFVTQYGEFILRPRDGMEVVVEPNMLIIKQKVNGRTICSVSRTDVNKDEFDKFINVIRTKFYEQGVEFLNKRSEQ